MMELGKKLAGASGRAKETSDGGVFVQTSAGRLVVVCKDDHVLKKTAKSEDFHRGGSKVLLLVSEEAEVLAEAPGDVMAEMIDLLIVIQAEFGAGEASVKALRFAP
jgi:hypothetical protein